MDTKQIEILCKDKEKELINKYFGFPKRRHQEAIGEYTKDLPHKIEAEYQSFLEELWKKAAPEDLKGSSLFLEEKKLRELMTDDNREAVDVAYKDAVKRTLWERIIKTNHEDVARYIQELVEYSCDLLYVMRHDFMEEVTGEHINNKAFEDDR